MIQTVTNHSSLQISSKNRDYLFGFGRGFGGVTSDEVAKSIMSVKSNTV